MCSITLIFNSNKPVDALRTTALDMSRRQRHRGPDWSGSYSNRHTLIMHERLAIVDPSSGRQPLISDDGNLVLAVNGEIYNHKELKKNLPAAYGFKTESDCEVILALYKFYGLKLFDMLNGMFAFALYDSEANTVLLGRDHIGIVPLYMAFDNEGNIYAASEMKALAGRGLEITELPPGHYYNSTVGEPERWYTRPWTEYEYAAAQQTDINALRSSLEAAVHRQLMSDVPYGVLLSGGLDSSVISAIAKKYAAMRVESNDLQEAWYPRLHSFAVGLKGAPDLAAAQKVADHIGTIHHEVHFTVQEGLDALRDVIYHIETYDVTTIRASTPMYLLARVIKSMGIKMVLSGEGSDELFGGYLYFHKAPNAREFHNETVRKLSKLHKYDCLRANKSLLAWGVEGRVPFLDKEFIDTAMGRVNPADKMSGPGRMEKFLLRQAFEDYLPHEVAWRQKEQFSDGVGYSWIDSLKDFTAAQVSDAELAAAGERFSINTPRTKEEYYYRSVFEELFGDESAVKCVPFEAGVACSTAAALEWDEAFKKMQDPSGRAVGTHNAALTN